MIVFASTVDLTGEAGQSTATRAVYLALRRQVDDGELHLVAPRPRRPEALPEEERARMHPLPTKERRSWTWSARSQLRMGAHLARLLGRGEVEAVIGRLSASMVTAPLLSRAFGIPYLLLARGMGPNFPVPGVRRLNARLASVVYGAFPEVRAEMRSYRPGDAGPVRVLPNAADPDLFRPLPLEEARAEALGDTGIGRDDFLVGFAGRMEPRYRLEALIEAAASLRREGRAAPRLLLVGEGPDRSRLEALAAARDLDDEAVFTGWVDQEELVPRLAACDVLYGVVDATWPSSPIKCYEYLACGRPVIVRASEEFEFIERVDAGIAVDEETPDAVAEAMAELAARGREERLTMGRAGRAHVVEHHTWERVARVILDDVDELRAGRIPAPVGSGEPPR